jgi:hypothetical protein
LAGSFGMGMTGALGIGSMTGLSGIASAIGLGPGTTATTAAAAAPGIASGIGANTGAAVGAAVGAAGPAANAAAADVGSGIGASLGSGASSASSTGAAGQGGAAAGNAGATGASSGDGADSGSPSRKTTKTGLELGQGLVVGMRASEPSVAQAGASMANASVSAANAAMTTAATNSAAQTAYNTALAGGFGAGLIAASNGVTPIAQDYGLMLGYSWAENVVTGAQNVLKSADFTALTTPKFGSQLAQANLGKLGLLPPAGSGAEYYTTTSGSAGMVQMAPITVNNTVMLDGQVIDAKMDTKINTAFNDFANSIPMQRG